MTLLLGFAAVNTGNNLLYLLVAALLGFMTVSGILGRSNLAGLRVAVEVPDEIYDGVPTLVTIRLENRKRWLPAFLVRVEIPDGGALFTVVAGGGSATATRPHLFRGRGVQVLTGLRLTSPFPVNFFLRRFPAGESRPITVFPAPRRSPAFIAGAGTETGGAAESGRGYEGEVSRIRDYAGEPLKLIHWKLSARQETLKVRDLSAAAQTPAVIDPSRLPGPGLEERLGAAVWLINRLHRQGRPVGLRLGGRVVPPALSRPHRLRLLAELARHDPA